MAELTSEGLIALLILLPGFLASELVRVLSTRPKRSEFDKIIQAFIYSLVVYVCFSSFSPSLPITIHIERGVEATHYFPELHFWPLIELTGVAIGVAIAVATMMNHDFPLSIFKKLRITQKTFRPSVWNDVFQKSYGYVQVELADGRNIIGWLAFYSDTPQDAALYLEDAAWLKEDKSQVSIDGPGILLTKESGIRTIMFLKAAQNPNEAANTPEVSL
jgi:hypothetical protein